jgi:hypothetical protein
MSRKLATQIKDSAIPGKWKRIAEAYAAFANNDGTNIYPSKEKLGKKAGCGPDTVYRQTPDLLACGLLSYAQSHTCRVENCNKGATHFTGVWGHYTVVYNLHIENLQNAETYLSAKYRKVCAAKCRKVGAANCDATQALKETPASASPTLGTPDSSALTSGSKKESKQVPPSADQTPLALLEKKNQTPNGFDGLKPEPKTEERQAGDGPQTFQEMIDGYFDEAAYILMEINPQPTDAMVRDQYPACKRILGFFMTEFDEITKEVVRHQRIAASAVLRYNWAHRDHKYATRDDKKLKIRSAQQYLRAMETGNLLNDYLLHDFDQCEICKAAGVKHYDVVINNIIEKRKRKEKQEAEARTAKPSPPKPLAGSQEFNLSPVSNEEAASLAAWFKEHGKAGLWSFGKEDSLRLGVSPTHIAAVLRHMRQNKQLVTKEQFEELLKECSERTAMAAYDVL